MSTEDLPYALRRVPGLPGSSAWWAEIARFGTPIAERVGSGVRLTFVFEAPAGSSEVLIDVNGVTTITVERRR